MLQTTTWKKAKRAEPCTCKAYPFPHRPGSGKCLGSDGPFCDRCGLQCSAHLVDNGIGAYEYWGARGVDTRLEWESDCCSAGVSANAALTEPFDGPEEDY